jgi:CPA2 family monovalent cation:H+ antiporter-2
VGILRVASALSRELASRAFPLPAPGRVDMAAAPRAALIVTLRIAAIVLLGLPLVAITQPFIPSFRGSALLVLILAALAIAFWRSVTNLQGHAKAGAEVILLALSRQMNHDDDATPDEEERRLARIRNALPGLGEPVAILLTPTCRAVGHTLADLNMRGVTGATVLAISRNGNDVLLPNGHETLRAGDALYVAGTARAVAAARVLLLRDGPAGEPSK